MAYSFQDPQFDVVNLLCGRVWAEFLDDLRAECAASGLAVPSEFDVADELLDNPRSRVSIFAALFADYCLVKRPVYGGPLITDFSYKWDDPTGNFTGPSWLYRGGDEVTVVFNNQLAPLDGQGRDCQKAATTLFIHEVGHVLLNWGDLAPPGGGGGFVNESNPRGEMMAWWFCVELLKMNLGAYVKEQRQTSHFDAGIFLLLS